MSLVLTPCELPSDAVEMGRIGEAWGIKGWVRLIGHNAQGDVLLKARRWYLQKPVAPHDLRFSAFTGTVSVELAQVKTHADGLVALIDGLSDRNAAELLKGARIFVPRSEFPASSDPDEFYWIDLIGLAVVNREGVALGTVTDLMATGPTSVLVLGHDGPDGKPAERLIPFVSAYVDSVDKTAGRIVVDWQPDY